MMSLRVGTFSFGSVSKALLISFCSSSFVWVLAAAVDMSLRNAAISSGIEGSGKLEEMVEVGIYCLEYVDLFHNQIKAEISFRCGF